jgi:hypothetical protein
MAPTKVSTTVVVPTVVVPTVVVPTIVVPPLPLVPELKSYHDNITRIHYLIKNKIYIALLNYNKFDLEHMKKTEHLNSNMLILFLSTCDNPKVKIHVLNNALTKPDTTMSIYFITLSSSDVINYGIKNELLTVSNITKKLISETMDASKSQLTDDKLLKISKMIQAYIVNIEYLKKTFPDEEYTHVLDFFSKIV